MRNARKAYWAVAGEGSARRHYSHRFVPKLRDGGFLVKRKAHLVRNDKGGDRCSSVSAVVVEGLMNNVIGPDPCRPSEFSQAEQF